jgi:signal transduction histidine kinase
LARPDGPCVSVLISAGPLTDEARDVIGCVVTMIDVTQRRRAEVALQQAAERLELLHEIDRAILAAHSSDAIAQAALGQLHTLVACWRVGLSLFDVRAQQGLVVATVGRGEARFPAGTHVPLAAYGARDLAALQAGQTYVVEDIRTCSPLPDTVQALQGEGLRAYARVPLVWQGQLLGALNLWADRPGGFSPERLAVASEVADLLAVAIQQARLHEQVQRHAAALEARVAERTAELAAANQELEAFSYSVSHDLRAPLRSLDGFSQILLEDYADVLDAEGLGSLQRIRGAAQRMAGLIDALLSLSRLTRTDLQWDTVELSAMARAIAADLQRQEPTRQAVFTIADGLTATGDARLLRIVLENLLGNAWKFTARQPVARIAFGALAPPDGPPVFVVRDNGVGFDMAYAGKLFGAFQRLHHRREFPGTGIGLATVQRIVHRHGGRIWAEGAVGQGAAFYFTLTSAGLPGSSSVPS